MLYSNMDHIKNFLDTSTIHGLSFISSSRRYARLFWIFVVLAGFIGAFCLIYESFNNWKLSPVSTTIETWPIDKLTLPNVTICPPKNSFLTLNYDILQVEKENITDETRQELYDHALEAIQDSYYDELMKNLSKVEWPHLYYNWYQKNTLLTYPYFYDGRIKFIITTAAASGNISNTNFAFMGGLERLLSEI